LTSVSVAAFSSCDVYPNLVSRNVHHIAFSKLPFCDGVPVRIPALTVAHCDVLRPYTKAIALEHVSDVLP
jgi:hypothetical protein